MKYLKILILSLSFFNPILAQKKPNIVFILADDLGQEDLGCYGNPFNETPNIDKLAKAGILFNQAYSCSPVCTPSRSGILTGKHPARTHITNFQGGERKDPKSSINPASWQKSMLTSEFTLAESLKEQGYQTAMVGKWHLAAKPDENPWKQGFDFSRMIHKNSIDYYNYSVLMDGPDQEFKDTGKEYLTDKLTDYALEFLKTKKTDSPFFLYLPYSAPHVLLVPRGDKVAKYLWKYEKFKEKYNPYYAAVIESLDEGVGKVMEQLKQSGELDNTIFVFTSDNGFVGLPELGYTPNSQSKYRKWKGHAYEGGIKVPLIVSWPEKLAQGKTTESQVINTDFFNTFSQIVMGETNTNLDSKSFFPALLSPETTQDRGELFWHYPHISNQGGQFQGAIRKGNMKLVRSYETNKVELFDLSIDPAEKNDLSKKNKVKATELNVLLTKKLEEVGANMPVKK
ncbi:MAG: sulfatase [Leadbetterella sp.]